MSQRKHKFHYPHPILKSFQSISQQSNHYQPYAYQNYHTNDPSIISYKLLRSTHLQPLMGSPFSLLLHPLHPALEIDVFSQRNVLYCKQCHSVLNTTSINKLSLLQLKCKYCQFINQYSFNSGQFVDSNVFDIINNTYQHHPRKILFVIQANQLLYQKSIFIAIINCLKALSQINTLDNKLNKSISDQTQSSLSLQQQPHSDQYPTNDPLTLNIGFIFFDTSLNYIWNFTSNHLTTIDPSNFQQQPPLTQSQIFRPLHLIDLQTIQQIGNQIMYSSQINKFSCLVTTLNICHVLAQLYQVQSKIYTCTQDVKQKQFNKYNNISKKQLSKQSTFKHLNSRVQIYLMDNKLYNYYNNLGLNNHISKSYSYNQISQNDLYYNLYHHLTQQTSYDTQLEISSSELIISNTKKIHIPFLTSNTPIIIDFNIPVNIKHKHHTTSQSQKILSNQCIQLRINFHQKSRIITYKLPKINCNIINQPYLLNDQTFFYIMIYKFLNDVNLYNIKKYIINKCKQIIHRIIKIQQQQFGIPKNLTNFFMYSFMILQHEIYQKKSINFYTSKQLFIKQGLQTITKNLYPKLYQFYPQLIPLKFKPKNFILNAVRLVDNGLFIGIVIGNQVNQNTLTQLFNTTNIDSILSCQSIPMLPNPLNTKLHESLSKLRQLNQLYYLPLKIIELGSRQYQQFYGNYLYIEDDHRRFFSNCLKN